MKIEGWQFVTQAMTTGRPILFVAWHGQTHLQFPLIHNPELDISRFSLIIVGDHRQQVLESFAASIGCIPIPISMEDNSLEGARNLIVLIKALRNGRYSLITPDGPDGPPRVPKSGVAFIAARAEAQVLPIAACTPHAYHLRRWDRYALPLPFARIFCSVRPAIPASRDADPEALLAQITRELNAANDQVEAMARRRK